MYPLTKQSSVKSMEAVPLHIYMKLVLKKKSEVQQGCNSEMGKALRKGVSKACEVAM